MLDFNTIGINTVKFEYNVYDIRMFSYIFNP
jgi:hypothetical protein